MILDRLEQQQRTIEEMRVTQAHRNRKGDTVIATAVAATMENLNQATRRREEHEDHLRIFLSTPREKQLFAKLSEYEFWLQEVCFLNHEISRKGVLGDPSKVKAVLNWERPKIVTEIRSSSDLQGIRRFIKDFSLIALPLTKLTRKNQPFVWDRESEASSGAEEEAHVYSRTCNP
ncbi:uncharacterized protein LOC114726069 [Neltuma alba]|uniref:uncharacterized protein LOC114726069 n=1 Tax=Neltuma alba TaxID=207710 RepID=UPI0010A3AA0D|nr:uncharacterized protein LOC114726069 [Prosopis alba]